MIPTELSSYLDSLRAMRPLPFVSAVREELEKSGWSNEEIENSLRYFEEGHTAQLSELPKEAKEAEVPQNFITPDWVHHDPIPNPSTLPETKPISQKEPLPIETPVVSDRVPQKRETITTPPSVVESSPVKQRSAIKVVSAPVLMQTKNMAPVSLPKSKGSGRMIAGIVAVILCLGGGAGAAYAYANALWIFDRAPFSAEEFLGGFSTAVTNTVSGGFTATVSLDVVPRSGDASASQPWADALVAFVPTNVKGSATISGTFSDTGESSEEYSKVLSEVRFGDILAVADFEVLRKGGSVYTRLNKFPQMLLHGDFDSVKGVWIRADSDDVATLGEAYRIPKRSIKAYTKKAEQTSWIGAVASLVSVAVESRLLSTQGEPIREVTDGKVLYKYALELHENGIPEFVASLGSALNESGGDMSEALASSEEISALTDIVRTLKSDTTVEVWVDRKGKPQKISITGKVLPANDTWKEIELRIRASLSVADTSDTATPLAPTEFIGVDQAALLLSGLSKQTYALARQMRNIEEIQGMLEYFALIHDGEYPDTLQALATERGVAVWIDVYTNEPFGYSKLKKGYALRYMVEFPPYDPAQSRPFIAVQGNRASLRYIPGLNTADKDHVVVSIEAAKEALADADKDGLTDTLEGYIGTDPKKKDTNGDSVTDSAELINAISKQPRE